VGGAYTLLRYVPQAREDDRRRQGLSEAHARRQRPPLPEHRVFDVSQESNAQGTTMAAQQHETQTTGTDASVDDTAESQQDSVRKKRRGSSKEAGNQRSRAKKRVADNPRSVAGTGSSQDEPRVESKQDDPRSEHLLSANDDARTAGSSSSSPPKPSVDVVSANGLPQEASKPPEPAAQVDVVSPAAQLVVASPAGPLPPPIFAESVAVIPNDRGMKTSPAAERQSVASKPRDTSPSAASGVPPGANDTARRAIGAGWIRSSAGFQRKQGLCVCNYPGLTAVMVAACCLLLVALLIIVGYLNSREERPSVGICETPVSIACLMT
ncbi:hypothetical protein MTO96_032198, partial [Rhipicephalus appendiculatus]